MSAEHIARFFGAIPVMLASNDDELGRLRAIVEEATLLA